jgi:hypothetical protein
LYRKGTNPAYIPAKTFSTALVALASGGAALPVPLQQALDAIEKQVGEDATKMEAGIEDWYNASMDRVSGWYKRHTQIWLFFLAVVVTLAMNVDAVQVAQALSANPQLAAQIADTAGKYADQNRTSTATSGTSTTPATTPASTTTPKPTPASGASTTPPPSPAVSTNTPADTMKDTADAKKKLDDATKNLNSLGIPIGWDGKDGSRRAPWDDKSRAPGDDKDCWGQVWYLLCNHWAGWLVTMIAISFGAPFWFDMLNRFMVVRSTVKPAEKSPTEGAKS